MIRDFGKTTQSRIWGGVGVYKCVIRVTFGPLIRDFIRRRGPSFVVPVTGKTRTWSGVAVNRSP